MCAVKCVPRHRTSYLKTHPGRLISNVHGNSYSLTQGGYSRRTARSETTAYHILFFKLYDGFYCMLRIGESHNLKYILLLVFVNTHS